MFCDMDLRGGGEGGCRENCAYVLAMGEVLISLSNPFFQSFGQYVGADKWLQCTVGDIQLLKNLNGTLTLYLLLVGDL